MIEIPHGISKETFRRFLEFSLNVDDQEGQTQIIESLPAEGEGVYRLLYGHSGRVDMRPGSAGSVLNFSRLFTKLKLGNEDVADFFVNQIFTPKVLRKLQ